LHYALKKELRRYIAYIGTWQTHFSRQHEREASLQMTKMQHSIGTMCKVLKGPSSAPITRLRCRKRQEKSVSSLSEAKVVAKSSGTKVSAVSSANLSETVITTDPEAIDNELQAIWGSIHAGNLGPATQEQSGPAFLRAYGSHFVAQDECRIERLTSHDLKEAIKASPDNAPGLDGVLASDMELLSELAIQKLVDMLQAIEDGADWPEQTLTGRTAWLDKTDGPETILDPLDFRGLAILSKVYRIYGVIRLRHLQQWIRTWAKEELFAGTSAPCGAEDAWYLMGLDLDLARLTDLPVTGGSADIWKCFDQVQRRLL